MVRQMIYLRKEKEFGFAAGGEKVNQIIIHVDMDAFYASVEIRDNPALKGKPLLIGSLPQERGVVATCSYEARKYSIHSAMNIKEAYRLCPQGVYMHPNFDKYRAVSNQLHEIWNTYASASETIAPAAITEEAEEKQDDPPSTIVTEAEATITIVAYNSR